MTHIELTGAPLSIETINQVAYANSESIQLTLAPECQKKILKARKYVDEIIQSNKVVYGINTGFGALASTSIPTDQLTELQYNLIRSHCTGVGEAFSNPIVRTIMLLRAHCLTQGFSGVSLEAIERLIDFINFDITPVVPCKGSVGASGDLAPLSHIALCLIGEGEVFYQGQKISSLEALNKINKKPVILQAKDGLGLINGTAVMSALGSIAAHRAQYLLNLADVISALTLEAVRGTAQAFHPLIHSLKPHVGQIQVAQRLTSFLQGSDIITSHSDCDRVQDPYSLRCIPQVHGACRQTLEHMHTVLNVENNAVTDNPLVFVDEDKVISGGNFHGEAIAMSMDYLAIGMAELCNISERRIEKLMNKEFSNLPPFLTKNSGLHSGLMIAQVTAAALTSENKVLAHPSSVDSIPTSTDKEDHVSMGVMSGRKLLEILENTQYCLAIEILCAYQGIQFLRPLKTSAFLEKFISQIETKIAPITHDRVFATDIEKLYLMISNQEFIYE